MNLYLVHHGHCFTKEEDPERGLNEDGETEVMKIALFLKHSKISFDAIYHSSKKRAIQTAEIIAKKTAYVKKFKLLNTLEPENDLQPLIDTISNLPSNALLVGHLPNLELLTSYLLKGSSEPFSATFAPACAAHLTKDGSIWQLKWLINPNSL